MMHTMQNQSLSGIEIAESGSTIRFTITETFSPYNVVEVVCEDVVLFHFHRTPEDDLPYFLGEISWVQLAEEETSHILKEMQYEYSRFDESPVCTEFGRLYKLRFEGGVFGVVLCAQIKEN